ncbi:MAG: putative nucleotidyltransferase component of viral defense system [Gammaproteobacteria bacterium]|jgi:predicted nucleotidyltransferase component of viral defense system
MINLIQQRLDSYNAKNPIEEEQAIKEIIQEIALYALWRADFFDVAAFQGGTSLRILHKLPRFSEDLDFILKTATSDFEWTPYLESLLECFEEFGLQSEVLAKGQMNNRIKKAIIKDNSIANQLNLSLNRGNNQQKLRVKLEIDVKPPGGSGFEYSYLDFPLDFEVCHQDLASNFALKIHAILCWPYVKGRDWYDFNWYVKHKISPNLLHLKNALIQYGPWVNQEGLKVNMKWLKKVLKEKINTVDWNDAEKDVTRFLNSAEQQSLRLWSERFFTERLEKLTP